MILESGTEIIELNESSMEDNDIQKNTLSTISD